MMERQTSELSYLRAAIRASRKVGLFAEFSDGYRMYREDGDGVEEAAWRSLYDWDIEVGEAGWHDRWVDAGQVAEEAIGHILDLCSAIETQSPAANNEFVENARKRAREFIEGFFTVGETARIIDKEKI
jgi:hypothetical protein